MATRHRPRLAICAVLLGWMLGTAEPIDADTIGPDAHRVTPTGANVPVEIFGTGLVNPRGLAFRLDGSLLVAEAGDGGRRRVEQSDGPYATGRTGRVTRFTAAGDRSVAARDLPSTLAPNGEAFGPSAVTALSERIYVRIDDGGLSAGAESRAGLLIIRADGRAERLLDFPDIAAVPRAGDAMRAVAASGLIAASGRIYATDPIERRILQIKTDGETQVLSPYSADGHVPSAIAAAADGSLYIAELGPGRLTRISPDGRVSTAATDLGSPIGVTVDRAGGVYVLDAAGRVERVGSPGFEIVADGLREATAIAAGPDGNLYVSTNGRTSRGGEGQVVRLRLVAPSDPTARRLIVVANWGLGLIVFAVAMGIGLRYRERGARPPAPEPTG